MLYELDHDGRLDDVLRSLTAGKVVYDLVEEYVETVGKLAERLEAASDD